MAWLKPIARSVVVLKPKSPTLRQLERFHEEPALDTDYMTYDRARAHLNLLLQGEAVHTVFEPSGTVLL